MLKSLVLGVAVIVGVVGLAGAASAAEKCGPKSWKSGLSSVCQQTPPGKSCPNGWHLAPGGRTCLQPGKTCPTGYHVTPGSQKCSPG